MANQVFGAWQNDDIRVELSGFVVDGDVTEIDIDAVYIFGHRLNLRLMSRELRSELRALEVDWEND